MLKILILIVWAALLFSGCGREFSYKQVQKPPGYADKPGISYTDSLVTLAPGNHYKRGALHRIFFGSHYRKVWSAPVTVPVLDLSTAKGGLSPVKKGGSSQTFTLRLQNPQGHQYVLRSVDKDPSKALPESMRKGFIANLMRDQTSTSFPYAPYIISQLAEAVGVNHTNPKMVYIPHDPGLGEYLDDFGGILALLEERPEDDWSGTSVFGNSEDVTSSKNMLEEIVEDNDNKVDQHAFARARLLDMLVGDWSRREDQWRWAFFKREKGGVYKPVPRDRDHAMFKINNGFFPWVTTLFIRNFKSFGKEINGLRGLNKSGSRLDNTFLTELTENNWLQIADSIKNSLTDAVIEGAVKHIPDTIYKLIGEEFTVKLKSRREQLPEVAREYYKMLAKKVILSGTDKHERFEVRRLSKDSTIVNIYKINKKGEPQQLLYNRGFSRDDTKAIYLLGLDGKDYFELSGKAAKGIRIYMTGGAGEDTFTDESALKKSGKRTYAFDTPDNNSFNLKRIKITLDNCPNVQNFDGNGWLLRYRMN